MVTSWEAWRLDHLTWGWLIWMVFFFAWETYSLSMHPGQELTAHLRPMFQSNDLSWFIAAGLWVWLGWHFLVDGLFVRT